MALQRDAIRVMTLGMLFIQRPSWAAAHVQNFANQIRDHREGHVLLPAGPLTLPQVIERVTGAHSEVVDQMLSRVPQPRLRRPTVLYGRPDGSGQLLTLTYSCCRLMRPGFVLETGVANGFTTAAVLQALAENDHGLLVSVDLPNLHPQAPTSTGAAVDARLTNRWRLQLGPAHQRLQYILRASPLVDIFVQDASHTVRGQLSEYRAVWPRLRVGGLLISDDISHAFPAFASEVDHQPIIIEQAPKKRHIGVIQRLR